MQIEPPQSYEEELARHPQLHALRAFVATELDDDPGHDLAHCERVARTMLALDPSLPFAQVVASALMHDLVNVPKDSKERGNASALSATRARELLPGYGFSESDIEVIALAILDHSYSRGAVPTSALGQALQDADRLEAIGALGLFRTISTGTRMGARYFDSSDPFASSRELDDLRFTVDHFFTKLLTLPKTLHTEAGRAEAERRVAFLREFLSQLASELHAELPRLT